MMLSGSFDREPDAIYAAHLASADPDDLTLFRQHDRVRSGVFSCDPCEPQICEEVLVRCGGGHHFPLVEGFVTNICVLNEKASHDTTELPTPLGSMSIGHGQQPKVGLRGQDLTR